MAEPEPKELVERSQAPYLPYRKGNYRGGKEGRENRVYETQAGNWYVPPPFRKHHPDYMEYLREQDDDPKLRKGGFGILQCLEGNYLGNSYPGHLSLHVREDTGQQRENSISFNVDYGLERAFKTRLEQTKNLLGTWATVYYGIKAKNPEFPRRTFVKALALGGAALLGAGNMLRHQEGHWQLDPFAFHVARGIRMNARQIDVLMEDVAYYQRQSHLFGIGPLPNENGHEPLYEILSLPGGQNCVQAIKKLYAGVGVDIKERLKVKTGLVEEPKDYLEAMVRGIEEDYSLRKAPQSKDFPNVMQLNSDEDFYYINTSRMQRAVQAMENRRQGNAVVQHPEAMPGPSPQRNR